MCLLLEVLKLCVCLQQKWEFYIPKEVGGKTPILLVCPVGLYIFIKARFVIRRESYMIPTCFVPLVNNNTNNDKQDWIFKRRETNSNEADVIVSSQIQNKATGNFRPNYPVTLPLVLWSVRFIDAKITSHRDVPVIDKTWDNRVPSWRYQLTGILYLSGSP